MPTMQEELETLLKKYPDPRKGILGVIEFKKQQFINDCPPRLGFITDNKDPDCLGRVKVASDMIAPGAVTDWVPIVRHWAEEETGFWQLPEIGTQVLLVFPGGTTEFPLVLGCLWDDNHKPPKHSTKKQTDSILYQTKNHRLEIIDESGKEAIVLQTANGKMRCIVSKDKGIEVTNELGDISIECKKLTIESEADVQLQAKKKLTIEAGEDAVLKSQKTTKITSDKEITCKGKNIKLEGSKGVATEGKQIAKQDDKVMGFDIHKMKVPSGSGTAIVPLPHPFIGKLADKLSENVKISGKGAATKGSKAKHDDAMHMQLPGTISFDASPKKEGEVTNGTGKKVKINGKEVAVIGSTVTTCNDMGAKDNSTIIAVGASIPMPAIINPKNMKEYNEQAEKNKTKKPQFTTVKWGKTSAKEGEELELSAQVKDIDDGNMVTLQVWKDGQDPASQVPQEQIPLTVDGGVAKGKWVYRSSGLGVAETKKPKFFFTAHSAWCPMKKSDSVEIGGAYQLILRNFKQQGFKGLDYELVGPDGSKESGTTGSDGTIKGEDKIPGAYKTTFKKKENKK